MTLEYWREYRTQFHIATSWGLSESTVCRIIQSVEDILKDREEFHLPGKKALRENSLALEIVVVDVGETPVERPKKNKERYYSGKKKRHPTKSQVIADVSSRKILYKAKCLESIYFFLSNSV